MTRMFWFFGAVLLLAAGIAYLRCVETVEHTADAYCSGVHPR